VLWEWRGEKIATKRKPRESLAGQKKTPLRVGRGARGSRKKKGKRFHHKGPAAVEGKDTFEYLTGPTRGRV